MRPENLSRHRDTDSDLNRQALDWLVRSNGQTMSLAEIFGFRRWYARSPAHAQAWAEASRLWRLLLPATQVFAQQVHCPVRSNINEPLSLWRSWHLHKTGIAPLNSILSAQADSTDRCQTSWHRHPIKGPHGRPRNHYQIRSFNKSRKQ